MEFCCEPDSSIGQAAARFRECEVVRLTLQGDLTTDTGLQKALRAVSDPVLGPNTMLWGSVPSPGAVHGSVSMGAGGAKPKPRFVNIRLYLKLCGRILSSSPTAASQAVAACPLNGRSSAHTDVGSV